MPPAEFRPLHGIRAALSPIGSPLVFLNPVPWEVLASDGFQRICSALALEAPPTIDGVVVITSTWRPALPAASFSWHHAGEAVDWRTGVFKPSARGAVYGITQRERIEISGEWAARVAARVGSEFDVVFGNERHLDHGHAERDGRKVARVYMEG